MGQAASFPPRRRERLTPNPKARLRDQVHEVARFKQLSFRTEEAYWDWIRRYLVFHRNRKTPGDIVPKAEPPPGPVPVVWQHGEGDKSSGWRHPRDMGAPEVRDFLVHLAVERQVAPATQNQVA